MTNHPPPPFYIGLDGGDTKTAAVIINAAGEVLGRGVSGGANYHHHGVDAVRDNLWAAMSEAAARARSKGARMASNMRAPVWNASRQRSAVVIQCRALLRQ